MGSFNNGRVCPCASVSRCAWANLRGMRIGWEPYAMRILQTRAEPKSDRKRPELPGLGNEYCGYQLTRPLRKVRS